ncbi:MAG: PD40 domain-containing protein [Chloroflexi bacterium]|nr:PD40 domain-containing protein [Chloroflexota bacterium]
MSRFRKNSINVRDFALRLNQLAGITITAWGMCILATACTTSRYATMPTQSTPISIPTATPTKTLNQLGEIAFILLGGSPPSSIYAMSADGIEFGNLTKDRGDCGNPAWSRDGQQIAFLSWREGAPYLYMMDRAGTRVRRIPFAKPTTGRMGWSPNGKHIVFTGVAEGMSNEIWTINVDTLELTNLTKNPAWDEDPTWSPDGTQIAFASDRDGQIQIYTMNTDGSQAIKLTDDPLGCYSPDWSPDAKKIAFACNTGRASIIYTMNADGSQRISLMGSGDTLSGSYPSWSADGSRVAFEFAQTGLRDIYVMNADGSNVIRLTNVGPLGLQTIQPAWRPAFK